MMSRFRGALGVLFSVALVVGASFVPTAGAANEAEGEVTLEWLGWNAWRVTSPTGKVLLLNPFITNPASPVTLETLGPVDLILVTNGHGDEVGQTIDIALQTGATIVPSGWDFGRWFIGAGVPRAQVIQRSPGERYQHEGITIRLVQGIHGTAINAPPGPLLESTPPATNADITSAFYVTFENGWTLYYGGSGAASLDMTWQAGLYQPHAAIVHLSSSKEPLDFAMAVKFLSDENANLSAVLPGHLLPREVESNVAGAQAALDALQVGLTVTAPAVGERYRFSM